MKPVFPWLPLHCHGLAPVRQPGGCVDAHSPVPTRFAFQSPWQRMRRCSASCCRPSAGSAAKPGLRRPACSTCRPARAHGAAGVVAPAAPRSNGSRSGIPHSGATGTADGRLTCALKSASAKRVVQLNTTGCAAPVAPLPRKKSGSPARCRAIKLPWPHDARFDLPAGQAVTFNVAGQQGSEELAANCRDGAVPAPTLRPARALLPCLQPGNEDLDLKLSN